MPDFGLGLRITSTICFLVGGGTNLCVFILARTTRNDSKSYILLLQLAALANFLHSLAGWIATNRHVSSGANMIFISYGPGGLLGPRFCGFADSIAAQAVQFNPMMVSLLMIFRCLILYDYRCRKRNMIAATLFIYLLTFPIFYLMQGSYISLTDIPTLNGSLAVETQQITSYAMGASTLLVSYFGASSVAPNRGGGGAEHLPQ